MTPPLPAGLKDSLKDMLGAIPLTVELYASLRPDLKTSNTFFNLPRLEQALPALARAAGDAAQTRKTGDPARKHVALFGYLPYWLEYQVLIGLTLAGLGCETSLLYWPYRKYNRGESRFDLRRQAHYLNHLLDPASPVLRPHLLLSQPESPIPAALQTALEDTTLICRPEQEPSLMTRILTASTTLGARRRLELRRELDRRQAIVRTPYGPIVVQLADRGPAGWTAKPEYESCREAAERAEVPLRAVRRAAREALDAASGPPPESAP